MHSYIVSAIHFEPSQLIKTFIKLETRRPTNPEILRYYVVKAPYIPEIIGTKLKQPTKKKNITIQVLLLVIDLQR